MKLKLLIVALFCSVLGWGQTNPTAFDLSTGSWTLTGWNSNVPAGSYPGNGAIGSDNTTGVVAGVGSGNMMFWKNGTGDAAIGTAESANITSNYTVGNGKVVGNGTSGFYFDNTGGVGIGSAVLAINTTNRTAVQVAWTGRTIAVGPRQYGIRLQYRVGTSGAWTDANGTVTNILYTGGAASSSQVMPVITLPTVVENQAVVQLLWRFYYIGPATGVRPQFGVDEINVTSSPASSNTITTDTAITGSPFCVSASTGASVSVPFTSVGTFNAGNTFTAQLSNSGGGFGTPINIGTLSLNGDDPSGIINATIPAGTTAGTGYRIRVVSNNPTVLGSDNTVNLTVQNSAAITAQPSTSTQTMCQGVGAAALSVTATGTTLSYQWYSNTTATTSGGTPVGTSSASYTPVTTATGTLYYYCVVSAACGASVTSNVSGAVNVNPIPADPTGSITISANPSCGPATLSYPAGFYWQTTASGTSITNPTSSNYILNATGTIYVRSYNGSCWSTNSINTGVITINTPINISVQPTNQSIGDGSNTTFSVTATGTTPTYQWQVDTGSGFVDLANGAPYSNVTTATMTITGATLAMNGYLYRCVVSGVVPCASVISNSATLTVNTVPEINVLSSGTTINDNDLSSAIGDNTDFGSTDISTGTIVKTFTIENLGLGVLNLTGTPLVAISGTHAADFTLTAIPSTPIASSGSTTFQITFNPSALGIRDAVLTIANNDSNENPYNFSVQGRGTTREINVRGNAVDILDGDNTPSLTDDTDFGSVNITSGTIVKTFTIQNTSFSPNGGILSLTDPSPYVVISGPDAADFSLTTIPLSPIAVSGSTTFQITFNPTTAGVKNATISIANDDSNENPYNFDIRGTGTDTPDIVLSSANPAVASSTIVQSVNNHVIYAFDLAVTTFNATLNNVVFNTSGTYAASSITNFKLWYSTDATFNSATDTFLDNETATLGAGSHTFTGFTRLITNGSTGYFFITTDIPCTATAGHTIIVDAITTADLTFVAGNKSGTAFASGTHTIQSAIPNNVTGAVTSVCENGTATISWTAPAGCRDNVLVFATSGTFTAAIPTGNGGAYTDNAVFGSGTAFDGGFTVFKGTGTSVTVTGLTNGSTYRFKIFTRNDLNWSNGVEVSCTPVLTYCASGATNATDSEIENVTLIGYSTTISNNTTNVCTTGVNNYTAMSADLQVGGTYTLTVEFGDCNGGNQYDGAGGFGLIGITMAIFLMRMKQSELLI
ncbi:beta strand repeat-containing protein [Flavobacterium sp.]|uniref:beta strand repeat-containing protein n=1 Tax=Flavobacterium sp. TaxID=239 RepID=UPI0035B1AD4B